MSQTIATDKGFEIETPNNMSRNERRSRLRFYEKELKKHTANKPTLEVMSDNPEVQEGNVDRLRGWATRYGILTNKIQELNEFKRNS